MTTTPRSRNEEGAPSHTNTRDQAPRPPSDWGGRWFDTTLDVRVEGRVRIFDLAVRLEPGMARHPHHPEYSFEMVGRHDADGPYRNGVTAANEKFAMGGHLGTHMDGLGHVAKDNYVFGGRRVASGDELVDGLNVGSIEESTPIVTRGHLVDGEALFGRELTARDSFGPDEFESWFSARAAPTPGSVVLLRTGQMRWWSDPERYLGLSTGLPGVNLDGARWLSDRGVVAVGSDTMNFEHKPSSELINLPVHVHLLVECGIPIMEMMQLEHLAAQHCYEFTFLAVPLRIGGATGSPIRPLAIVNPTC